VRETSFFWHDYETWGADPRQDRIAQFAGVRTDTDLNIIGDPLNLYCRPPVDRLPQPEACLVTGITPQQAQSQGLIEADFMARVHEALAEPGTCGVGYNSLRFDDEFTRYGLYRNFYDPYAREWQNGNGRWDIIDMLRLTRALRPQGIQWPTREDGAPSFRLEELTAANGLSHEHAHDALSDVTATIAMARLVRDKQPKLYQYVLDNKDKHQARRMVDLRHYSPILHVSGMFPAQRGSLAVVMPLLQHPSNQNGIILYDLAQDPRTWLDLDADEIAHRLYTPVEDLSEGEARIGLKTLHLNRCPVLAPIKTLTESAANEWGIDLEAAHRHRDWLLQSEDLHEKLRQVFSRSPFGPSEDPEAALYEGFLPDSDKPLLDKVREASPKELATGRFDFQDERMGELLFRYRARNWPDSLKPAEAERWQAQTQSSLSGDLPAYEKTLERLRAEQPQKSAILNDLARWPEQLGLTHG
jgi:exodeoxyribonuclease-1